MRFIKLLVKIPLLPVLLIIRIAGVLLYGAAWITAYLIGPVLTFLFICATYSVFVQNWRDVAILGACVGLVYLFFMVSGVVIAMIQTLGDLVSMRFIA